MSYTGYFFEQSHIFWTLGYYEKVEIPNYLVCQAKMIGFSEFDLFGCRYNGNSVFVKEIIRPLRLTISRLELHPQYYNHLPELIPILKEMVEYADEYIEEYPNLQVKLERVRTYIQRYIE